ncbi:MAG: polyketide synthase, partial [Pseudomonadota bacterium]
MPDDISWSEPARHDQTKQLPVAIIGMSARLPGARDIAEYWSNLSTGQDVVSHIPGDRWDWTAFDGSAADPGYKSYANQGGFISAADCFDSGFFGFLPKEAQSMDPQQRLFLEASYAALEDAGIAPKSLAGSQTGVFVGVGNADYPVLMRENNVPLDGYRGTGMALTAISNRVSFHLDLRGPSSSIDTACSGSLVAIHRAMHALETGECDLAIVGGVNLIFGPELYVAFSKAEMLSPRGRCHTFDDSADGYVRGEGVGALILRRLDDAEEAGDHIHGVILGSAENHGGRAHSFT